MRTFVKVTPTKHTASASSATRYISERERSPEREEPATRSIFTQTIDWMKATAADRHLAGSEKAAPAKRDVLHLVIAFNRRDGRELERLGPPRVVVQSDRTRHERQEHAHQESAGKEKLSVEEKKVNRDAERKIQLLRDAPYRTVIRGLMSQLAHELRAEELRWAATVHRHTNNPHVHILIARDYKDTEGQPGRLSRLPINWLNSKDENGRARAGLIDRHLSHELDRILPAREVKATKTTTHEQTREAAERDRPRQQNHDDNLIARLKQPQRTPLLFRFIQTTPPPDRQATPAARPALAAMASANRLEAPGSGDKAQTVAGMTTRQPPQTAQDPPRMTVPATRNPPSVAGSNPANLNKSTPQNAANKIFSGAPQLSNILPSAIIAHQTTPTRDLSGHATKAQEHAPATADRGRHSSRGR